MHHRSLITLFAASLSLAAALVQPAQAQEAVPTHDFDVYVDLPTGFAYIKTPMGWKFIRRLDATQLAKLHPSTLTTLLTPEADDGLGGTRYAQPAPRKDAARTGG